MVGDTGYFKEGHLQSFTLWTVGGSTVLLSEGLFDAQKKTSDFRRRAKLFGDCPVPSLECAAGCDIIQGQTQVRDHLSSSLSLHISFSPPSPVNSLPAVPLKGAAPFRVQRNLTGAAASYNCHARVKTAQDV